MTAVPIDATNGMNLGAPIPLFDTGLNVIPNIEQYAVASDGERFLISTPVGATSQPSFVFVQNWFEELRRLVPTN